ncbi:MAG: UPF0175 family protein [Acidobacteria bacterium]|nr:UPF0175 family protein [Acidobacteriota bacterium]
MKVTVDLPEDIATGLGTSQEQLARVLLESAAIEGYRSKMLSEEQVRRMLGLESRLEVHQFLKIHGVPLNYSVDDLEHDLAVIRSNPA